MAQNGIHLYYNFNQTLRNCVKFINFKSSCLLLKACLAKRSGEWAWLELRWMKRFHRVVTVTLQQVTGVNNLVWRSYNQYHSWFCLSVEILQSISFMVLF